MYTIRPNVEINNDYFRCRVVDRKSIRFTEEGNLFRCEKAEVVINKTEETLSLNRYSTTVKATEDLLLNSAAAFFAQDIPLEGNWWNDRDRYTVLYFDSVWQGEGELREKTFEELGLYPTYNHQNFATATLTSHGSWTTSRRYPLLLINDKKNRIVYTLESEFPGDRIIEIGTIKRDEKECLYVYVSDTNEILNGWFKTLKAGETFTTESVLFGEIHGGIEDAFAALTEYKRKNNLKKWDKTPPVFFNDYMNCLWGKPDDRKLLPLIDAAAEAGCEGFCIDAGWFRPGKDAHIMGDWIPCDEIFGKGGLKKIITAIREKGMIPGLWLELEAETGSEIASAHPEYLVTRHGVPAQRRFLDFRKPEVRAHLHKRIDALVELGVGYFKNDYNGQFRNGCDSLCGGNLSDGAKEYSDAFLSFIDEVYERHPGLLIENCGSGAMRCDNRTLRHFCLQSVSDQEDYYRMPAIVAGANCCYPPEKAGIWAYPYPLLFSDIAGETVTPSTDGQIRYNLSAAFFGTMYLSGRLEHAEEHGMALIKEGVKAYKSVRSLISASTVFFPTPKTSIHDDTFSTLGLYAKEEKKALVAVFANKNAPETVQLNLPDADKIVSVQPIYGNFPVTNDGKVTVTAKDDATVFEVLYQ